MTYFDKLREVVKQIPVSIIDFSLERDRVSAPTQASSNFITNKEQGDWAEEVIMRAVNDTSDKYIAVRYGKSDDIIAGEKGFDEFFDEFQDELSTIGKRPDLLIFKKEDFKNEFGFDISKIEHKIIHEYVKLAVAGLEIRSSAFLINTYESEMQSRTDEHTRVALKIKDKILSDYSDLLEDPRRKKYVSILENINLK